MLLVYLQEYAPHDPSELAELCRDSFDFNWDIKVQAWVSTPELLIKSIKSADVPALFIMDDAKHSVLDGAVANIRGQNALHYLVLILCSGEDALRIRPPFYRPSGFLMRPIDKKMLHKLLEVIYDDFSASHSNCGGYFSIKIRGTVYQVPYDKILFFESSGKKIIARTNMQQYDFYYSLDEIVKTAPDFFLRVHRSICVNTRYIRSVNFSERVIYLTDDSVIPFSRTFKQELLQAVNVAKPLQSGLNKIE